MSTSQAKVSVCFKTKVKLLQWEIWFDDSLNIFISILWTGIRYSEGAIIPDNTLLSGREEPTGRRREYIPSADPGSRLPHMNVRVLASEVQGPHSPHTPCCIRIDPLFILLMKLSCLLNRHLNIKNDNWFQTSFSALNDLSSVITIFIAL